jgi:hypothetical protein
MTTTPSSPWLRLRNGALFGLVFPGGCTLIILAMYALGGRYQHDKASDMDLLVLSISYPIGSVLLGAILALAGTWVRGFLLSTLVGIIAITPFVVAVGLGMDDGLHHWNREHTIICGSLILVYGAAIGYGMARTKRKGIEPFGR